MQAPAPPVVSARRKLAFPGATSMQNQVQRRERAAAELAAHSPSPNPEQVVDSLLAGLTQLRDLLATRLHEDVALHFGADSMIAPTSVSQGVSRLRQAGVEIDAYASVVVDEEVTGGGYLDDPGEWFLDWIFQLQFGDDHEHARQEHGDPYRGLPDKTRRLRFLSMIHQALPESVKTPPVLFLLFPLSVRIVAAVSFDDALRAKALRKEQTSLLSAISDCRECQGRVLGNDQRCLTCGNPVWTIAWLRTL